MAKHTNASFVEIALADEEEGVAAGSEEGSRPVTALRRTAQSPAVEMRRTGRTPTGKSFEAYASTEEEVHESHTAYTLGVEYTSPPAKDQDSLTLPDSLNEFEGEQYQSPQVYPDSLGHGGMVAGLDCPPDSLQFPVSPTPALASKSPLDSLIAIKNDARAKMTAAEFFDSITSIEKTKPEDDGGPSKRRIIPYCDNSLSSGTSAFTSQDVSFDSKDSSPSDNDRGRQVTLSSMVSCSTESAPLCPSHLGRLVTMPGGQKACWLTTNSWLMQPFPPLPAPTFPPGAPSSFGAPALPARPHPCHPAHPLPAPPSSTRPPPLAAVPGLHPHPPHHLATEDRGLHGHCGRTST